MFGPEEGEFDGGFVVEDEGGCGDVGEVAADGGDGFEEVAELRAVLGYAVVLRHGRRRWAGRAGVPGFGCRRVNAFILWCYGTCMSVILIGSLWKKHYGSLILCLHHQYQSLVDCNTLGRDAASPCRLRQSSMGDARR